MPIEFNCPSCFKGYRVADDKVGKRVACKECGNSMTVPDMSGLSFADEDTGLHRRPAKRHSSTKILPADRPKKPTQGPMKSLSSGAKIVRNIPSDTARLEKPAATVREKPAATVHEKPAVDLPAPKVPGGLKGPADLPKMKTGATRTRAMPDAPKKRMVNLILLLGAAALCTGFALPWFTLELAGFTEPVAGYAVPLKAPAFAQALVDAGWGEHPVASALHASKLEIFSLFALYLLPLLALFTVINDVRCAGKGKSHWWWRILLFMAPVLIAGGVYAAFQSAFDTWLNQGGPGDLPVSQEQLLAGIGYGVWPFLGGWLLTGLAIVVAPKVKKPSAEISKSRLPASPDNG